MQSKHQQIEMVQQIALGLKNLLKNYVITDVFKVNKTELVLIFNQQNETISLKLFIQASQFFINFYEYALPRGQSVYPLFKDVLNQNFEVNLHPTDRIFSLRFTNNFTLVFKLYGPLSNILLFNNNEVVSSFRPDIKTDAKIMLHHFAELGSHFNINTVNNYYIYKNNLSQIILLFEPTNFELIASTEIVFDACNLFAKHYLSHYAFVQQKQQTYSLVQKKLNKATADLHATQKAVENIKNSTSPEEIGHILMANLHAIKKGESKIKLPNFYTNTEIEIKLKKDFSPQQNAEHYYKKAKNTKTQLADLNKKIETLKLNIEKLTVQLNKIKDAVNFKNLKPEIGSSQQKPKIESKFKNFGFNGYTILVGKSSANNDALTKYAHKNDLWLHAKDFSGSHVIIKQMGNKPFTKEVIAFAAQIAAYYSKAKSSSLVPVSYTLKKYVRKPKGALPGQVFIDKEEVILVEPKIAN